MFSQCARCLSLSSSIHKVLLTSRSNPHLVFNVFPSPRFLPSFLYVHLLLNLFNHAPGRASPSILCCFLECLRNIQDSKAPPSIRAAGWPTECSRHNPKKEGSKRLFGRLGYLGNADDPLLNSRSHSIFVVLLCSARENVRQGRWDLFPLLQRNQISISTFSRADSC